MSVKDGAFSRGILFIRVSDKEDMVHKDKLEIVKLVHSQG